MSEAESKIDGDLCCSAEWEAAYTRFETPAQEIRKFVRRLRELGCEEWPREVEVAELFCGRGNGLVALEQLGFRRLEGVDLSATLASQYRGNARIRIADCRQLPLDDASKDVVVIQGGLHHLEDLGGDLERTLAEAHRVLRENGRLVLVEPWLTPFLQAVHVLCESRLARRCLPKVESLATMIEHERTTYERWLAAPRRIRSSLNRFFEAELCRIGWGKLKFLGKRRSGPESL